MAFHVKLYTSSDLLHQPWISDLTHMVNVSYRVSHTAKIKFATTKTRLLTDSALSEELGADGFTAVALVGDGKDRKIEVIGTASMKKWKDDGLWTPTTKDGHDTNPFKDETTKLCPKDETAANNKCADQIQHQHACPGDYELAVVALPPDPQYRGRGIAGHLVKACEEEVLRRHRINAKDFSSPVRMMIRVVKEDTGAYWLKQGFTVVGSQRRPKGFWNSLEEFTMWAMVREVSTI
ncbi:hypothetical protein PENCOP_c005G07114 [Penicillium coprophilum]|uniref:N-acetyltransferase domain-containing protein n=1 Tax=Penicillium coprophilum TaxID=36646 RepID=A0A1V6US31_9EURO|nr:hypothetical protein PENCOP_c005G07114 [Penicillium coprophilum]